MGRLDYKEFLKTKYSNIVSSGFNVEDKQLNSNMFDFQKHITKQALKAGRYAVFADCGLGKTFIQLEWAKQVSLHTKHPVLILAPLAVSGQTIQEGRKFNIPVYKITPKENPYTTSHGGIWITNYEQLDNIDIDCYAGIVLDESSILKNFTGKTKKMLIEKFNKTPYKLCCTATPAPNDLNEIGNHSEFLNILEAPDMRAKWFIRDEGMNNYRLKKHGEKSFFAWISSWATMIMNPADIGFNGSDFKLPALNFEEIKIKTDADFSSGNLFNEGSVNATNFNYELRRTTKDRLNAARDLVLQTKEPVIIWVKQNQEADYMKALLPDAVEVRGSEDAEVKEQKLLGFANGDFRILITKAKIAQFGLNYQHCHKQIFASLDFSFETLYQAVRRCYRYGQKEDVSIYIITTDTMENVVKTIKEKERGFKLMQSEMNKSINSESYGLKTHYDRREYKEEGALLIKGDSCIEIKSIPDNSIDFIVYSPPFASLFTYSNYIHDMGNSENLDDFFKHYDYLLEDLYRILKPGRLMSCHTKDLARYKNSSGYTGLYDFTGDHHRAVEKAGFKYHTKITIWTDPVLEMQRTKTQRLLYKQVTSDSSYSGVGCPEYVTIFRKWEGNEDNWTPIENITKDKFPLEMWQRWASPVWFDILRTDVLNNKEGTGMGDEKHIAPLQLEVIKRLIHLYTNKGETVFTPFLGIGSEAYVALQEGRKAIGIELKDSYFDTAIKNCRGILIQKKQLSLIA